MTGKTHANTTVCIAGTAAAATIYITKSYELTTITYYVTFMAAAIEGSLYPDLDRNSSFMSSAGIDNLFSIFFKHRGELHTLNYLIRTCLSPLFFALFFYLMNFQTATKIALAFTMGLASGYLIHLIEDTFNRMGIMWLYPFNKKFYSLNLIMDGDEKKEKKFCTSTCIVFSVIKYIIFLMIFAEIAITL